MSVEINRTAVGVMILLAVAGLGFVARTILANREKALLEERAVREAAEKRANLLAFEAESAHRREAEAAQRLHDLDEQSARDALRREHDSRIRNVGGQREQRPSPETPPTAASGPMTEAERVQRVRSLEAQRAASPWGKVQQGMTRDEVRRILGQPKWTEGGIAGGTWMYLEHTTMGCGSVAFVDGRVESVRDPFFCQSWSGWGQNWPGLDPESRTAMEKARRNDSGAPSYPIGAGR